MLLIIGGLFITTAALSIVRVWAPADVLGWMSEQWLAEHRAAHPS
jgi:hypothetical protein